MCTKHGITVYKLNKYTVLLFVILPIDLHGNTVYNTIKIKVRANKKEKPKSLICWTLKNKILKSALFDLIIRRHKNKSWPKKRKSWVNIFIVVMVNSHWSPCQHRKQKRVTGWRRPQKKMKASAYYITLIAARMQKARWKI